ncbi:hypothetical protein IQ31_04915 [Sphingobacterium siyangense]|uniref:Uncharacterized protein n=1 Tax=Sphingobacterium siyangense TaxID=459529 RepID=A0A562M744_9SPHI|nr:hypothetical protein IQ31_04915 [Sphingobacterium siyangense]
MYPFVMMACFQLHAQQLEKVTEYKGHQVIGISVNNKNIVK